MLAGSGPARDVYDRAELGQLFGRARTRADQLRRPLSLPAGSIALDPRAGERPDADAAPATLAKELKRWTRRADSIAQLDDKLFVVLCPDTSCFGAALVADRLARAVQRYLVQQRLPGSVDFGHASYPDHGRQLDPLLETALRPLPTKPPARPAYSTDAPPNQTQRKRRQPPAASPRGSRRGRCEG